MIAKVFIDTDVIISSSLSKTGAAFQLLENTQIEKYVSNLSIKEAHKTAKRLRIAPEGLQEQLDVCKKVKIGANLASMKRKYGPYVHDITDAHVVGGAVESKSQFLATYNLKDFKIELIKREFNIIVLTPGTFLQYLRSKE